MSKRLSLFFIAMVLVFIGYSCSMAMQPAEPQMRIFSSVSLVSEKWYEVIYDGAKDCASHIQPLSHSAFDEIEWFATPQSTMSVYINSIGLWSKPNRIYIDERYVMDSLVIRHELLHYILQRTDSVHNAAAFLICSGEPIE